ncbi:coiled-coil-helix-coiled-coil-helix domain-containing protein 5 [Sphaerodactylus townsendi]|uniref:coiled-coil-helix-coiled-coil-helix domain-containing protein 5 n=1 Tax=Sphaerodactylus townsendi TaxID=933632 RepID=UPI00202703DB|nr:coiled-coil-helix-coiled-coil-helix domain-containing protein 5 [Sphaerodactylus townsendi]
MAGLGRPDLIDNWSEPSGLFLCFCHSPIIQKIRNDCAEPFAAFEQCLKENQTSVMNCAEHVQRFLHCADQVKLAT